MPLLPGHGTALEDMIPTRFSDWSAAAEEAYERLASRTEAVVVAGLSMGGALTNWLAERHPEIVGIILINPQVEPVGAELADGAAALLAADIETIDGIGNDIAKEGGDERAYSQLPLAAGISLFEAVAEIAGELESIRCPALLFSSSQDHVVAPTNGAFLMERIGGPVDQVILERSYHVATLDHEADLIEDKSVAFIERITAGLTS